MITITVYKYYKQGIKKTCFWIVKPNMKCNNNSTKSNKWMNCHSIYIN